MVSVRFFTKAFTALSVCMVFVVCAAGAAYAAMTGTIIENGVNIRKGSSTDATVITRADKGQIVVITGTEGDFYHVYFSGVDDGYVSTQFVKVSDKSGGQSTSQSQSSAPAPTFSAAEGTGKVDGSNINIRSKPATDSSVLGKAAQGDTFKVVGVSADWYKIIYNGQEAYITKDFLKMSDGTAASPAPVKTEVAAKPAEKAAEEPAETIYATVISETGLYLRQSQAQDSAALNAMAYGEIVDVTSVDSDWVGVVYEGMDGYVSAEYVIVQRGVKPEKPASTDSASPLAQEIIEYGKQFLGTPYVYGGTSLTGGVDCSGFVYSVMKHFGIGLNRSSTEMAKNGVTVDKNQLQPGDLVFFSTDAPGRISHVGIYIGNRKFIHSSSSKRTWGVTISSLDEAYYNARFLTANRVL